MFLNTMLGSLIGIIVYYSKLILFIIKIAIDCFLRPYICQ